MKNLINAKVTHKIFGNGTVIDIAEKIIIVKFADCEKKFGFPESFETHLKCTDAKIQKQILRLIEENKKLKEEEKLRAEELRQKEREIREAQKKQTDRNPSAPKTFKSESVAFKCTYCDGGRSKKYIGFKGVCSKENIRVNINEGRNWCSRSDCRDYYDENISYKELKNIFNQQGSLCYECRIFSDWEYSVGWTSPKYDENGDLIKESKPKSINKMSPGSLAVLTTRLPEKSENERVIFTVFLVDDSFGGDDHEEGFVTADPIYRLAFNEDEANQLLFWNFYKNPNSTENTQWGTGLFRYISHDIAANILKCAAEIKRGTKEEKFAMDFFEHFCKIHEIDSNNLPECTGALKLKS